MSKILNCGNKQVAGFIPARGGSNGIKHKNLSMIKGKGSLLEIGILNLLDAGFSEDHVFVSTQDGVIKKVAHHHGVEVIDRPLEFCTATSPTEEAIGHFLQTVPWVDVVVMIQVTSPLLKPFSIRDGLKKFIEGDYDSLFSAVKANDILIWNQDMKPINYDPLNRGFRQTRENFILIETGAFFIFTREIFKKTQCRLAGKVGYSEVPFWQSFQVDTYTDLSQVKKLMAEYW